MMIRRVVICMALVACIAVVSPVWGDRYHSHLLPGDLRSAADALDVQTTDDYYVLSEFIEQLIGRLETLTAGCNTLEDRITSLEAQAQTEWLRSTGTLTTGKDVMLSFKTVPGARCTLSVFYLGTRRLSTADSVARPEFADEEGLVTWNWPLDANAGQDAQLTLHVELPDGRVISRTWQASIVEPPAVD